jgi:hypothetical protein
VELHDPALGAAGLPQRMDALVRVHGEGLSGRPVAPRGGSPPKQAAEMHLPPAASERDYWLCRCEGFAVESPTGRTGVVDGVRFLSRVDQPDLLEVRAGLFRRRLLLVPAEEVEGIFSSEKRLVLRSTPRVPRTQRGRVKKPPRVGSR